MSFILKDLRVLGGEPSDLAVSDGRLVDPVTVTGAQAIDCAGLIALPGLVDPHTHLREPGDGSAETIESGTKAAARGGFTACLAMANTTPVGDCVEVVERVHDIADREAHCDVHPVGAVTKDLGGEELSDIAGMAASRAQVRLFSDDGKCVGRSDVMRDALIAVREVGGVLAQHSQDPLLTVDSQMNEGVVADELGLPGWPAMAEESIIARDAIMAHHLGARVHVCHLSTKGAVEVVRWAKSMGYPVTAEVTPHHLILTDEQARTGDAAYKVNPPLRTQADVDAVRAGLADGTIDVVGTDHAPHAPEGKARHWCDAPMGMLGLETALPVVAQVFVETGRMDWARVAEVMSRNAARMLGLSDHGHDLVPGSPATLCLIDPARDWSVDPQELASIAQNTPFAGQSYQARVVATLLRGEVTHDLDGRFASNVEA